MIDKYQIYMLYKSIKKIWEAKRFNTVLVNDMLNDTLEEFLINQYVQSNSRVEYMSNYFIPIVNEINCNLTDIEHWTMYFIEKCLVDKNFPKPEEINNINKMKGYMIFKNRPIIAAQINEINKLIKANDGINELFDTKFTLYETDGNQENQAYKLYKMSKIDPEFYIQGYRARKFEINKDLIKDIDYKRFITFTEIIIKLQQEISNKNVK